LDIDEYEKFANRFNEILLPYQEALKLQQHYNNLIKTPSEISIDGIRDYSMADYQYEVVMSRIHDFEEELDDEHEVALKLAAFGQSVLLNVTEISYSNPSTLVFHGFVNGEPADLIQHVSMLNFLIMAVKKDDPAKSAKRIAPGFALPSED